MPQPNSRCAHWEFHATRHGISPPDRYPQFPSTSDYEPHPPAYELCEANLTHADLRLANMSCARLTNANLTSALLGGVDRGSADLTGANLTDAELSHGVSLVKADLTDAILVGANLSPTSTAGEYVANSPSRTVMTSATICRADLTEADLTDVRYSESTIWPQGFVPDTSPSPTPPLQ
ncbi:pentapeptide repeat-containing protein [Nocardia sp. NBC_00565]|nr:pentapeptide repeat-containing protein [Nocardia sp. NBC_00565]